MNPERYRLPDYPFIEKSERGCLSAGVGTVDKEGTEDGYYINNIRFFYQGNQCYFLMKNDGSSEGENNPSYYSTNVEFHIGDPNGSYMGEALKDAFFSMFNDRNDFLENPTKVSNSYKEYINDGTTLTKEELWSKANLQYELLICVFGNECMAYIQIERNEIRGAMSLERMLQKYGYRELFVKPYVENVFEPIDLTPLLNDHRVGIFYNSYTYNCGCLDLDINRFE